VLFLARVSCDITEPWFIK